MHVSESHHNLYARSRSVFVDKDGWRPGLESGIREGATRYLTYLGHSSDEREQLENASGHENDHRNVDSSKVELDDLESSQSIQGLPWGDRYDQASGHRL